MNTTIILLAGLCLILSCMSVSAQVRTSEGTRFMVGFMQNELDYNQTAGGPFGGCDYGYGQRTIAITSRVANHVTVNTPGVAAIERDLAPMETWNLMVDRAYECIGEGVFLKGIEITATAPVSVYCVNSRVTSTDGYLALPVDAWGTSYISANYFLDHYDTADSLKGTQIYYCNSLPRGGEFAVIAAFDSTVITVMPKATTAGGIAKGATSTKTLMKGEIYQVQDGGTVKGASDLTGSIINSNKPIGLLSGHVRAAIPITLSSRDHLIEMLPPVNALGKHYIVVPFAGRSGGDLVRIIAGDSGVTTFTIQAIGTTRAYTLNGIGEYIDVIVKDVSAIASSKSVMVVQYSQSYESDPRNWNRPIPLYNFDPCMVVLTPDEQFTNAAMFQTLPAGKSSGNSDQFDHHYATIIADSANFSSLQVNEKFLNDYAGLVTGILPGTGYRWATVELQAATLYRVSGRGHIGAYVYGTGEGDSYGWPAASINDCAARITANGSATLCKGDSLLLDAGSGFRTYTWSTGARTRMITVKEAGTYSVTTEDTSGCIATSQSVVVSVSVVPPVLVSPGGAISICAGDEMEFRMPAGFVAYRWSTGDTGRTIVVTRTGDYWVDVTTKDGCIARSDTARLTVHTLPVPTITQHGDSLTTVDGDVFVWYRDGKVIAPGGNRRSIAATIPGTYTVRVTDTNGCTGYSEPFIVTELGVHEDADGLSINLTSSAGHNAFRLDGRVAGEEVLRIELVDIQGATVLSRTETISGVFHVNFAPADLPTGAYLLRVRAGSATRVWRVVLE